MKLSAPLYRLKRQARLLSRQTGIAHHEALNKIAMSEGFQSWSLLAARIAKASPACTVTRQLKPGQLVLLAARPGHGKTLLGLELLAQTIRSGRQGMFFTLEYTLKDVLSHFDDLRTKPVELQSGFTFDDCDTICSCYITDKMATAPRGTMAVIDYLQLLDQRRSNPPLAEQISDLKTFARNSGHIIVLISQIDRFYDPSQKQLPGFADIRLPNPMDLSLVDVACFLNDGEVEVSVQ